MYQCCKVCKLLKYEAVETGTISLYVPKCPHFDFVDYFNFDPQSNGGASGLTEYARQEGAVEINGLYYRPKFSMQEYTSKETPRSVDELLNSIHFECSSVPRLTAEEVEQIRQDATDKKMPEFLLTEDEYQEIMELADDDIEPEDMPWHEFTLGNRNGVYYEYLGSFHDAFIEPFLWGNACEYGISKSGSPFTDELEIQGREVTIDKMLNDKLRKVFYTESFLSKYDEDPTLTTCSCGLPITNENDCPFCSNNERVVEIFTKKAEGLLSSFDYATIKNLGKTRKDIASSLQANKAIEFFARSDE